MRLSASPATMKLNLVYARVRTNSSNYSFFRIVRYRIVYSIRYSFSFQLTNTIRSFKKSAKEYQIHILPIFKTVLVQNCPKIFNLNKYCAEICMFQLMLAIICPFNTIIFMFSLEILSVAHFCRKNDLKLFVLSNYSSSFWYSNTIRIVFPEE